MAGRAGMRIARTCECAAAAALTRARPPRPRPDRALPPPPPPSLPASALGSVSPVNSPRPAGLGAQHRLGERRGGFWPVAGGCCGGPGGLETLPGRLWSASSFQTRREAAGGPHLSLASPTEAFGAAAAASRVWIASPAGWDREKSGAHPKEQRWNPQEREAGSWAVGSRRHRLPKALDSRSQGPEPPKPLSLALRVRHCRLARCRCGDRTHAAPPASLRSAWWHLDRWSLRNAPRRR